MKKLLSLLLLAAISTINAQDCKYKRNEVDEFTNHKILETKRSTLAISGLGLEFSTAVSFKKINDIRYVTLHVTSPKIVSFFKGYKLMFKCSDDSVIELECLEPVIANGEYINILKSTVWNAAVTYILPDDKYEALKSAIVTKVRVYTSDSYVDDDVKEKHWKNITASLKCID